MKRFGEVYMIVNNVNGKMYIGQTVKKVEYRWQQHSNRPEGKRHAIGLAIRKYGIENFSFVRLASCFDRDGLNKTEQELIAQYNTLAPNGYNLKPGGYAHDCHPETRVKMGQSRRGMKRPPITEATRNKLIVSHTGKTQTPETIEKRVSKLRGRKMSSSFIEKLRKWNTGRKMSEDAVEKMAKSKRKRIVDSNGVVYESLKEAADKIGTSSSCIWKVLNGKADHTRGLKFSYVKTDNQEQVMKRYNPYAVVDTGIGSYAEATEDDQGDWVKADEAAALIAKLTAERDEARNTVRAAALTHDPLRRLRLLESAMIKWETT